MPLGVLMKRPVRETARLSDSIVKSLGTYALAAGAASVGMLAASLPAEGEVIYTPTKVTVDVIGPTVYAMNPAGSQVAPFLLAANFVSVGYLYWDMMSFNPNTSGARFVQGAGPSWNIAPLAKGALIGPKRVFGSRKCRPRIPATVARPHEMYRDRCCAM